MAGAFTTVLAATLCYSGVSGFLAVSRIKSVVFLSLLALNKAADIYAISSRRRGYIWRWA